MAYLEVDVALCRVAEAGDEEGQCGLSALAFEHVVDVARCVLVLLVSELQGSWDKHGRMVIVGDDPEEGDVDNFVKISHGEGAQRRSLKYCYPT